MTDSKPPTSSSKISKERFWDALTKSKEQLYKESLERFFWKAQPIIERLKYGKQDKEDTDER